MHAFNLNPAKAIAAVTFLSALPTAQAAGLYLKSSPVVQVDAKSFDRIINKSNYTSVSSFLLPLIASIIQYITCPLPTYLSSLRG